MAFRAVRNFSFKSRLLAGHFGCTTIFGFGKYQVIYLYVMVKVKPVDVVVAALEEVKCGISIHPSHTRICAMLGEEERVILLQVYHPPQPHPHLRHAGRGREGHPAPGISSTTATPASAPCWERRRGSSCSRYITLPLVSHPALVQSSCSWSVILLQVSHPALGQSSCSWSVILLQVSHPALGQPSWSRSVILLQVSHPDPVMSSWKRSVIQQAVRYPAKWNPSYNRESDLLKQVIISTMWSDNLFKYIHNISGHCFKYHPASSNRHVNHHTRVSPCRKCAKVIHYTIHIL